MMRNLATLIPHILAVVTYAIGLSYASQHFEFESPALLWLGALIACTLVCGFMCSPASGFPDWCGAGISRKPVDLENHGIPMHS